MDTFLNKLRLL